MRVLNVMRKVFGACEKRNGTYLVLAKGKDVYDDFAKWNHCEGKEV